MHRFLPGLCALATASILLAPSTITLVEAAVVDAGALAHVSVDASYFDNQTDDCGSDGCYGELTRVSWVKVQQVALSLAHFLRRRNIDYVRLTKSQAAVSRLTMLVTLLVAVQVMHCIYHRDHLLCSTWR